MQAQWARQLEKSHHTHSSTDRQPDLPTLYPTPYTHENVQSFVSMKLFDGFCVAVDDGLAASKLTATPPTVAASGTAP